MPTIDPTLAWAFARRIVPVVVIDDDATALIYGQLTGESLATSVEYGAAHGALAMTTPGDTSMATAKEVFRVASGGSARVVR